ncbi:MAG TPA: ATP:cob(I)alamin adenosyltransferase, partial [Hansschlegelia sp.]
MVKLNKIYTRTGDDGTTGLAVGPRRPKHDLRIESFGTVDETNAAVGLARLHAGAAPALDEILARIQNELFDLGADLATLDDGTDLGYEP